MGINSDYSNYNTNTVGYTSSFLLLRAQLDALDYKIKMARGREDQVASLEKEKGTLIKDYGLDKYLSGIDADISMWEKEKTIVEEQLKSSTTTPENRLLLKISIMTCDDNIKKLSKEKEEAIRLVGLVTPVEQPSANSETSSAQAQESTSSVKSSARRLRNSGQRI